MLSCGISHSGLKYLEFDKDGFPNTGGDDRRQPRSQRDRGKSVQSGIPGSLGLLDDLQKFGLKRKFFRTMSIQCEAWNQQA